MKKEKIQIHLSQKQLQYLDEFKTKLDMTRAAAIRRIIDDRIIQDNDKKQ